MLKSQPNPLAQEKRIAQLRMKLLIQALKGAQSLKDFEYTVIEG
jgi:hypothetical protein